MIEFIQAFILGLVEGATEFLPVSSTGHLIIARDLLGMPAGLAIDSLLVVIQGGAILAVCWYYRHRIIDIVLHLFQRGPQQRLAINTVLAFLPAAIFGVLIASTIKQYLFNAVSVAAALVIGGLLILWIEKRQVAHPPRIHTMEEMTYKDALGVGLMQCLAMIPGTSRSGATIMGAMVLGLSRSAATNFSFFLGIPTILGATVYELWGLRHDLMHMDMTLFAVGTVVSFFSALAVVHWLIGFVAKHDFKGFGYYRIAFGLVILLTWATGVVRWE